MSKQTDQQERAGKTEERILQNKQISESIRSKEQQVDWELVQMKIEGEKNQLKIDVGFQNRFLEEVERFDREIRAITQQPPFRGQWRFFDMNLSFIKFMLGGAIDILRYLIDRLARMEKVAQMMMEEQK